MVHINIIIEFYRPHHKPLSSFLMSSPFSFIVSRVSSSRWLDAHITMQLVIFAFEWQQLLLLPPVLTLFLLVEAIWVELVKVSTLLNLALNLAPKGIIWQWLQPNQSQHDHRYHHHLRHHRQLWSAALLWGKLAGHPNAFDSFGCCQLAWAARSVRISIRSGCHLVIWRAGLGRAQPSACHYH